MCARLAQPTRQQTRDCGTIRFTISRLTVSIRKRKSYAVIGGRATSIIEILEQRYTDGLEMPAALQLITETFRTIEADAEDDYEITPQTIEVACLEKTAERRKFRRLSTDEVTTLLS